MKLSQSIVLRFKYNGSVTLVNVSLVHGLTWWWVAKEVLRLYLLSLEVEDRKRHRKYVRISRILSPDRENIDLSQRILYYDVKRLASGIFELHTEGPWSILNDSHLYYMSVFLSSTKDLNSLMRVSKRFHLLFSSDEVWRKIPFAWSPWQGKGKHGNESQDWQKIHEDSGLLIATLYRLRWIAHNTSRLKLYYGSIPAEVEVGFVQSLFSPRVAKLQLRRTVTVLGHTGAQFGAKHFMRKLHYLIPESATSFHSTRACRPLLENGMLLDVEPSPIDSRSRNLPCDPGTRVEGSSTDPGFVFRRIGDTRLTFLSMDFDTNRTRWEVPYDHFYRVTNQAVGNIILLDYVENDQVGMQHRLERLWSTLQYQFGANDSRYAAKWENHKTQRFAVSDTPVLVLLAIDWSSWVPLGTASSTYTKSRYFDTGIQSCVHTVCALMQRVTSAGFAHHHPRPWYIQPIEAKGGESKLNNGLFAGVNWLLRGVIAREQNNSYSH